MSARTTALIGREIRNGAACSSCGKSYAACTRQVLGARSRACCAACRSTGTHDERPGRALDHSERGLDLSAAAKRVLDYQDDPFLSSSAKLSALLVWTALVGLHEGEAFDYARAVVATRGPVLAHVPPL